MGRQTVGSDLPEKKVVQAAHRLLRGCPETLGHGRVQALDAQSVQLGMEHRDIAESDQPFRRPLKDGVIQLLHDTHAPVASPGTEYRSDILIVHRPLHIMDTLLVRACEITVHRRRIGTDERFQSPPAQHVRRRRNISRIDSPCRRYQRHPVSRLKIRRSEHTIFLFFNYYFLPLPIVNFVGTQR